MNTNSEPDALRSRWTLEGTIPLSGVAEGASWRRARSVATGQDVVLFIVRGDTALEAADAVRRAYLVDDPHLLPVQEIVVLDDPRETPSNQTASEDPQGPTTVVEYLLPPAPPLAALLANGPLHPETARAIIGEAATGLEAARRRGVRHQLIDSNRVFVDTRSGAVSILGIGVEAASHPGLDRSREVASFQDTAALVALLYRALTGRSPQHDAHGNVPLASTMVDTEIPQDLDLLCDLVLNESADEIPETTRGLIEALEPWQSIPVTLEAYPRRAPQGPGPTEEAADAAGTPPAAGSAAAAGSVAAGSVVAGSAAAGSPAAGSPSLGVESSPSDPPEISPSPSSVDSPVDSPVETAVKPPVGSPFPSAPTEEGGEAEEELLESTALMDVVPDEERPDEDTIARAPAASSTGAATSITGAAGIAGVAGIASASAPGPTAASASRENYLYGSAGPADTDSAPDDSATDDSAPDTDSTPAASTDDDQTEHTNRADEAARQPAQAAAEGARQSSSEAKALVTDLHLDEKRSSSPFPGHLKIALPALPQPPSDPAVSGTGAIAAGGPAAGAAVGAGAAAADLPSRSSGTHWPLAHDAEQGDPATLAPVPSPGGSDERALHPSSEPSEISLAATPDRSAPTPAQPVVHSADDPSTTPVPVSGRAAPVAPVREDGPIVIHGRDRSLFEDAPEESTVPSTRSSLLRDVVGVAVDTDAPETFTMGPRDQEKRSLQSQWIIIGGAIVVMVALVIALTSITRDLSGILEDPLATSAPPSAAPSAEETGEAPVEPTAEATEDAALPAPELAGVELFAEGSDREADHTDQQDRLTDGDPSTFWSTKHYGSPDYGGLKDGVGIRLNFTEPSTLTAVTLTTALNNGGTVELRAVNDDGSLGDVLSTGELAGDGEVRLETPEPLETDQVALCITELPPDSNESGRFRARIAEIQVE